jgi:hypothetical protein
MKSQCHTLTAAASPMNTDPTAQSHSTATWDTFPSSASFVFTFSSATLPVSTHSTPLTPVALQTMQHVELNSGAFMARITACHVTTYYHVSRAPRLPLTAGRLRLHGSRPMARCDQNIRLGAHLLCPNEAISHQELPIRIGELVIVHD